MRIRAADEHDIDGIVELLHLNMNNRISRERWRKLLTYDWMADKPDLGRVLEDDRGRITGFLGAVYADRPVNGRLERFVNLSSWYVAPDNRHGGSGLAPGMGHRMLYDMVRDTSRHYMIHTNSALTVRAVRRVGFRVLDEAKYVWQRSGETADEELVLERSEENLPLLTEVERRLANDHADLPVTGWVARAGRRRVFLMECVTVKTGGVRWHDVFHVSDRSFLAAHGQALANRLLTSPREVLACDTRFCSQRPVDAVREVLKVPRLYLSQTLSPVHFDHLYSEIPLLGLKLS